MIKIYGSPKSSAGRVYWMLEELGLPYERMPINMSLREHKNEDFLKLNPNGKIPCLVDGDFIIWESMAITTYLAAKQKSSLLPTTPEATGLAAQWSYWSILEMQKHAIEWFIQVVFVPAERKDSAVIEKAQKALIPLFTILDSALKNKNYLIGNQFTIADLHVASAATIATDLGFELSNFPNVDAWLKACKDRPAWHKVSLMGN